MESSLYQGNQVFRNQPSYKVFNKSIEQPDDTLFLFLNDVDADILKQEQETPTGIFNSYTCRFTRSDPRTQELSGRTVYDHSTQRLPYEFPNPQDRYSTLSPAQQVACVRLLVAWQRGLPEIEEDFVVWRVTNGKRCKEQQLVQKHIYEYAIAQKERLYAPMKPLVLHYGKWFERRMQHLLRTLTNSSYSTHSGLPQLAQCKALNEDAASMEDIQLVCRRGQVRLWPQVCLQQQELSTLRLRLERYAYAGVATEPATSLIAADLENHLLEADEDVFVLPLEALLMLLTPGAYVDLPTEMMLRIREMPDSEHKCIEFKEPLPARNCGWHTNSRLLTQAYAAYAPAQWLMFTSSGTMPLFNEVLDTPKNDKMQAEYKLYPIDEEVVIEQARNNCALISWRLSPGNLSSGAEPSLMMYSSLSIAAVRDDLAKQMLGCHVIKLENKPDCGCEIMTKYELLSAWLQLKLLQSNVGHCSRISLRDLTPLLEEHLTLDTLEQQLHEYYHISMPQQLCQLREFLKLLRGVAPGDYLLRYTAKYRDKFLLCQPTLDPTPKSFKLHDLLLTAGTLPNDINFLTQTNSYLPISPKLCSRLHEQLQLLPCAFPAKTLTEARRAKKKSAGQKKPKLEETLSLVQRTRKKKPKPREKRKRASRQRKRTAAKAQQEEDKELDKFMCL